MSRFTVFGVLALVSVFFMGCGKSAEPDVTVESKIVGKWKINVEKSIERFKTSPKVKPEDHASLSTIVEMMAGKIQMEITSTELKAAMGSREQVMEYTVTSTDADAQSVTVSITAGKKEVTVVYTMVDDSHMYFVSSGTDDMDYYVWQRVEETVGE
jgi:hypothetical protein